MKTTKKVVKKTKKKAAAVATPVVRNQYIETTHGETFTITGTKLIEGRGVDGWRFLRLSNLRTALQSVLAGGGIADVVVRETYTDDNETRTYNEFYSVDVENDAFGDPIICIGCKHFGENDARRLAKAVRVTL